MPAVTESMMYSALAKSISQAEVQVQRSQEQAATGLRVSRPDQDPVAAAQSSLYTDSLAALAAMTQAGNAALSSLSHTDLVLQATQHILASAEEMAIAAGSANVYPEQLTALSAGATALHDQLLALANAQENGTYLFAGFSGSEPFVADGTYLGDDNMRMVEVSPGLQVPMNLPGSQVFNVAGGQNILQILQDFSVALAANDSSGVDDAISNIQRSIVQVGAANARVGVYMQQAEGAQQTRSSTEFLLRDDRSKTVEIDSAASMTELVRAQNAYQAAITEAARILQELDGGLLR
jgi:flagellar hook-associated protein 3 FlgL